MNPLINAEIGMLYTTDSRFLAKIKYTRNPDSYTFIFSSLPESPLPKQVYLMPGEPRMTILHSFVQPPVFLTNFMFPRLIGHGI